jgi:hypothetical protein
MDLFSCLEAWLLDLFSCLEARQIIWLLGLGLNCSLAEHDGNLPDHMCVEGPHLLP